MCLLTFFEYVDFETSSRRRGEVPEKPFVNLYRNAKLSGSELHCEAKWVAKDVSFSNDDNRTWNERPMYYNQNKNTTHKKNYFYFHKTNGWMVSYI